MSTFKTKLKKLGNSLGIQIPTEIIEKLDLKQDSEVKINISLKTERKFTLEELMDQVTPENQHKEIDFGSLLNIMGTREAAEIWGISEEAVIQLAREGKIEARNLDLSDPASPLVILKNQPNPSSIE